MLSSATDTADKGRISETTVGSYVAGGARLPGRPVRPSARLAKVEGQVLTQVATATRTLQGRTESLVECHLRHCVVDAGGGESQAGPADDRFLCQIFVNRRPDLRLWGRG